MSSVKIDSGLFRNPNRDLFVNIQGTKKLEVGELSYPKPSWWWTGKRPDANCPGYVDGVITSLPLPNISESGTREMLLKYFDNTWTLTEVLFSGLLGEETFKRSPWHQLRHPMIFYYGHVACVYINKFRVAGLISEGVDSYLEQIMETGVDEMSWDDLSKNEMEWPSVRSVNEYRRKVYSVVRDVILNGEWNFPIRVDDPAWAVVMGFEHERIHLETSSVLIRELPAHLVTRPAAFPPPHPSALDGSAARHLDNPLVPVAAGVTALGKPRGHPSFGWDNEYGARRVAVPAFSASRFLVTNGELLEFVCDGGYSARRWWTEAGWQWRTFRNVLFPTFWVPDGPVGLHAFRLRAVFDMLPLPLAWPALVNAHEARAYCAWRSARDSDAGGGHGGVLRLPTEAEHHLMRDAAVRGGGGEGGPAVDPVMLHGGADIAACRGGTDRYNLQLAFGSESPVDLLPPSSAGVHDSMGNVWTWTEDDFNPLDGFTPSPLYTDFSTPCFDGLHSIIMGGSFISTGDEASVYSRFHFRPHFHQHAGFRMVSSPACPATLLPKQGTNGASTAPPQACPPRTGERDGARDESLLLHYGARKDLLPWDQGPCAATCFPARIARLLADWCGKQGVATHRALDLGCSVGGSTFELANAFSEVLGLDSSWHNIEAAQDMKRCGQRAYKRKEEGEVYTELVASVDSVIDRQRVEFAVADLGTVSAADYGEFDAVLLAHQLCLLADPVGCLARAGQLVRPGGLLVVATAASWDEAFTPRANWLAGFSTPDGEVRALDGIRRALSEDLEMVHREDVPMLVREHARKYQWSMLEASVWRRRQQ